MSASRQADRLPSRAAHHHARLARRVLNDADRLVGEMVRVMLAAAPALAADPVLAHDTAASTHANVVGWAAASIARPGEPVAIEVSPAALDLARDVVRRGLDQEPLITAYRQGQQIAWQAYLRFAAEAELDADELVYVLELASQSLFAYVDGVLTAIAAQMDHEREDLRGGAAAHRRETILLLLDGAPMAATQASARLGYDLDRDHVALILFGDGEGDDPGGLERHAGAIGRALGTGRPLTMPSARSVLWAWVSGNAGLDLIRVTLDRLPGEIRTAAGSCAQGVAGFCQSHFEAREVQRLLLRAGNIGSAHYEDIRAVSLASQDEERGGSFVTAALGELKAAEPYLRETVRVYLQQDSNATRTAELLFTHRNTILKRLDKAEGLLPGPLPGNGLDVRLALELLRWTPPQVGSH